MNLQIIITVKMTGPSRLFLSLLDRSRPYTLQTYTTYTLEQLLNPESHMETIEFQLFECFMQPVDNHASLQYYIIKIS